MHTQKPLRRLAAAALAVAALAAASFALAAEPPAPAKPLPLVRSGPVPAGHETFNGVWIGFGDDAPPKYKNTRYEFPPPFTPEGQKQSEHWGDPRNNLGEKCLPWGGPAGAMGGSSFFPIEMIVQPKQVTILLEYPMEPRRVFIGGTHPTGDDLEKTWMGHSIGHWEGATLVVDTVGPHRGSLNGSGAAVIVRGSDHDPRMPYDENLHLVERLRVLEKGQVLEDVQTIEDPSAYTHPLTVKRYWKRTDDPMLEYVCAENQRANDEGYSESQLNALKPK